MILQVFFGSAQTSIGYQFFDGTGALLGSRVTAGINAGPLAGQYLAAATPPAGAAGVYWDTATSDAAEDLRDSLASVRNVYSGYRGPGVYLDTATGTAGADLGTNGTVANPVDTLADAVTLAGLLGANRLYLKGESVLDLTGATLTGFEVVGLNGTGSTTINLGTAGSPSVLTRFAAYGATVYGQHDLSDRINLTECLITDAPAAEITKLHVSALKCALDGEEITLDTSVDNQFVRCYDAAAGGGYPVIKATGSTGNLLVRGYNGGLGINNLSPSHSVSMDGLGRAIFEAGNNVNAEVILRGVWDIVDNTAGMTNLLQTAALNIPAIAADLLTADTVAALEGAEQVILATLYVAPAGESTPAVIVASEDDSDTVPTISLT